MIAKTNTQHYSNIANSIRYSKDGAQYESDLVLAKAEIVQDNEYFSEISTAVQSKTGSTEPYDKSELAAAVMSIPTPLNIVEKDINFYDYDGTLLYSYTFEEANALTELPEAPTHSGLTFQEWNYTLSEIKENYVADTAPCNVGATYITDDGHTRLYMHLDNGYDLSPVLTFTITGTLTLTVDWGDGTMPDTISSTGDISHIWSISAFPADVMIDIAPSGSGTFALTTNTSGTSALFGKSDKPEVYRNQITHVRIGNNYNLSSGAFRNCYFLQTITIPNTISSGAQQSFQNGYSLISVIFPRGITNTGYQCVQYATNLKTISFPHTITNFQGQELRENRVLKRIAFINKSDGVMWAYGCNSLSNVVIPKKATYIGSNTFYYAYVLTNIYIPKNINYIGSGAFRNCYSLQYIDMSDYDDTTSIPELNNTNALTDTPSTQIIYVKNQAMLDAFSAATNWSTYADRFQVKGGAS